MCIEVFSSAARIFFFSSRRRHTRLVSDWSSDVCSSDLILRSEAGQPSDLGHHETGEQHVPWAAGERERDRIRDPDPFSLAHLGGFALHQTSRPSGPSADTPREDSPEASLQLLVHLTQMYTTLTSGRKRR